MYDKVYERNGYIIFNVKNGYIVYNTKKQFEKGHTHMKNYSSCVGLINLCIGNKIPRNKSFYFLTSLIRISNDDKYTNKVNELIQVKKNKTKTKYINNR